LSDVYGLSLRLKAAAQCLAAGNSLAAGNACLAKLVSNLMLQVNAAAHGAMLDVLKAA
jgi:hypothetical protein